MISDCDELTVRSEFEKDKIIIHKLHIQATYLKSHYIKKLTTTKNMINMQSKLSRQLLNRGHDKT